MTERGAEEILGEDDDSGPSNARSLRAFLVERYQDLRSRLVRRLKSAEWADDALQDTYLRLEGADAVGQIRDPGAYILRAAVNTALNYRRDVDRRLGVGEVETLLHIADDAPDAQQIVEGRSDLERLKVVMAKLPRRQQVILLAARLEGLTRQQIADRLGISVSMVEKELRKAQERCVIGFGRNEG